MKLLDTLERRLGRFAVPHVTVILISAQIFCYVLKDARPGLLGAMALVPSRVLEGEWWRLFSFLLLPPVTNLIFAFFFWYLFYLMGTALEVAWGSFRYDVYLLIGWAATVGVSFLVPDQPASAGFLQGSVFLAFAFLYPDFPLMLFFLLPVKIKWLAWLAWLGYFYVIAVGEPIHCLLATAAVTNFLLFFGKDILLRIRAGRRKAVERAERITTQKEAFHRCRICGITDQSHPDMDFRYCSKCAGGCCYCPEHLRHHEHVVAEEKAATGEGG